jgi:putative SOS response-associated peptidase YedK
MCGRYSASFTPEELQRRFDLPDFADLRLPPRLPRFNVAPTDLMPVVVERPAGRALAAFRWGFQPFWMAPGRNPPPINARAETVATSGLFRRALAEQRCIVPTSGFFEWQAVPALKRKQPHHIRVRGGGVFGFAGIYTPADGERPGTYAIITTAPNELLAPIHNRMPVILDPEWEALWLDPSVTDPFAVLPLLQPFPAERMEAYPVGHAVGAVANDGPELLLPLA